MIKVIFVILSMLLSGCDEKYDKAHELVDDGKHASGIQLPTKAENKKYIGNGWFTFELNGECFMYADKGRTSILTRISCDK